MIHIWSNWILKPIKFKVNWLPPVVWGLLIALLWLVEAMDLLLLLTVRTLYSYPGITHWSKMLWLSFVVPFGAFCVPVQSKNPAVTHFALIVPLPSSKECQRPVFLKFDSDILPQFLLTLQAYLTWQHERNTPSRWTSRGLSLLNPSGWLGWWNSFHNMKTGLTTSPGKDKPCIT